MGAFLLKKFGCMNALPGARDLDEDTFARHTLLFIQGDELAGFGNRPRSIEAQASCDLRRDAAGNHLENLPSEQDEKTINKLGRHFFVTTPTLQGKFGSLFYQVPVHRHLGGMVKQRGIRGGVLRPMSGNGFNVTRIRDYGCVRLERFKQRHRYLLLFRPNSLKLPTIVLTRQRTIFELSNLGQPAAVPICTAELGVEEVLRAIPRERDTHGPATEADYIHVVILHALAGRKVVLTKRRTHAIHLVGSHRSAYTAAAHQDTPFHVSNSHSTRQWDREIGIVVVRVIYLVAKINDLMSFCRQQLGELPLHLESTVICSYSYFHLVLPCRAI